MEHDLDVALPILKKLVKENTRLTTIYKELRHQSRFQSIGDYPIISWIARQVSKLRPVSVSEVTKLLKTADDGEFQKIHQDNDLVTGIYAQFKR